MEWLNLELLNLEQLPWPRWLGVLRQPWPPPATMASPNPTQPNPSPTTANGTHLIGPPKNSVFYRTAFVVQPTSRPAHESGWLEGVKTFACRQNCKSHKDRRADATHTTANGNAGNSSPLSQDGRLPCTRDVHTVAFTIATVLTQRQRTGCTRGSPPPPRLLPTLCRIVETQRLWSCA